MDLASELKALKFSRDGTGILMAHDPNANLDRSKLSPLCLKAVEEVEAATGLTARHIMVNVVLPGGGSGWHVDPGERWSRWHLAVETNASCWMQALGGDPVHLPAGQWFGPLRFWEEHRVWNSGETSRLHLIVDLG